MLGIGRVSRALQRSGAELVLHGHTHVDSLHWLDGKDARVPVVGVPAAGEAPGGKHPASGYNLITVDHRPNGWHCHLQRFGLDDEARHFVLVREMAL